MSAPNTNPVFIARQIGEWIRDLIKLYLTTELSLVECRLGGFELPVQQIGSVLPGVFVMPVSAKNEFGDLGNGDYLTHYFYRVVYMAPCPEGTQLEAARLKGQQIADLMTANVSMKNPTVQSMQQAEGIYCLVNGIEFQPPEDELLQSTNARYFSVAIDVECYMHTYLS